MNNSTRVALTQIAYNIQMLEHKLEMVRRAQLSEGWGKRADRGVVPGRGGDYFRNQILPKLQAAHKSKAYIKGFYDSLVHGGHNGTKNPDYEAGQHDATKFAPQLPKGWDAIPFDDPDAGRDAIPFDDPDADWEAHPEKYKGLDDVRPRR